MGDVLIREIIKYLSNTRYGRTAFTRGRSQNVPTDKQNLIRRKQIDTPTVKFLGLSGFVLFC